MSNYKYGVYSYYFSVVQQLLTNELAYECLIQINFDFRSIQHSYNCSYKEILLQSLQNILEDQSRNFKCMQYLNQIVSTSNNSNWGNSAGPQNEYNSRSNTSIFPNYNNYPNHNPYQNMYQTSYAGIGNEYTSFTTTENNFQSNRRNNFTTGTQNTRNMANNTRVQIPCLTLNYVNDQNNGRNYNQLSTIDHNIPKVTKPPSRVNFQLPINQKKLFFYDEVKTLTQWIHSYRVIYKNDAKTKKTVAFYQYNFPLTLDPNIFQIFKSNDFNEHYDILLRCVSCKTNDEERQDSYPLDMELYINGDNHSELLPRIEGKYASSDIGQRLSYPTVLTPVIMDIAKKKALDRSLALYMNATYPLNAVRKSLISNDQFCFKIVFCLKKSPEQILNEILKRPMLSKKIFFENVEQEFSRDDEIGFESMRISLQSSITMSTIRYPFRGKNCKHLIPDDLEFYLKQNVGNEKFKCKICGSKCCPDDIFIDEYFHEILKENPRVNKIEVYRNGDYKILDVNDSDDDEDNFVNGNRKTNCGSVNPSQVIIIDSSSDDECEVIENSIPLGNSRQLTDILSNIQSTTNIPVNENSVKKKSDNVSVNKHKNLENNSNVNDNTLGLLEKTMEVENTPMSNELVQKTVHHDDNQSNMPSDMEICTDEESEVTNKDVEFSCIDNPLDSVENEVIANQNVVIVDSPTLNDSGGGRKQKNNVLQNDENFEQGNEEIVDNDTLISRKRNSKDSFISTSKQSVVETVKLKKINNNHFRKAKKYIELKKAQFQFDPHPGDIFI